jgi:hypothetical protein
MVGMHIAFGVRGHPELVWVTFEHINNTPNVRYRYNSNEGTLLTSKPGCGTWLFSSGPAEPDPDNRHYCHGIDILPCPGANETIGAGAVCVKANHPRMYVDDGDIRAYRDKTIGPSDILRISPWGTDVLNYELNAQVISLNDSITWSRLARGDVRKNYLLIGALWLPSQNLPGVALACNDVIVGSNCLANSTMETFQQPSYCAVCHYDGPEHMLGGVSRIYTPLEPLFKDPPGPAPH